MYKILIPMLFVKFKFTTCNNLKQIANKLCSNFAHKINATSGTYKNKPCHKQA